MENLLRNATIGETANLANDVSTAITKAAITDAYLASQNEALKISYNTMISGIGVSRGKELTEQLEAADARRDKLLASLIHFVKGYLLWEKDEATTEAAQKLMRIVKAHGGNFSRESHERESAQYIAMMLKLETTEAATALETLELSTLAGAMKLAESNFSQIYQLSAATESGKTTVAPSSIKKNTQAQLNTIIDYLTVMQKSNAAVYGALALNIAQLVQTVNRKVRNRGSWGNDEDAEKDKK